MNKLSEHFSWEEAQESEIAARDGLDNTIPAKHRAAVQRTAAGMEAVRAVLGDMPIDTVSWYRSAAVNAAAKGSKTSQHCKGEAVDFKCRPFGTPAEICAEIVKSGIKFDQLILEFNQWVHISFSAKPRGQVLTAVKEHGTTVYKSGLV